MGCFRQSLNFDRPHGSPCHPSCPLVPTPVVPSGKPRPSTYAIPKGHFVRHITMDGSPHTVKSETSAFSRIEQRAVVAPTDLQSSRSISLPGMGIQRQLPVPPPIYPPGIFANMFQPYLNGIFPPPEFAFQMNSLSNIPTQSIIQHSGTNAEAPFPKQVTILQQIGEDRDSGNESGSHSDSPPPSGTSSSDSSRSNSFSVSSILKPEIISHLPSTSSTVTATPSTSSLTSVPAIRPNFPLAQLSTLPHMTVSGGPHLSQITNFSFPNMGMSSSPRSAPVQQQLQGMRSDQMRPYFTFGMPIRDESVNQRDICIVCHDNASGYHYGVMSCEGCKGFFRRTVQKNIEYTCHKDKSCTVDRVSRNRCQACRFQKCIQMGMTRESVRQDRNRKRKTKDDDKEVELDDTKDILKRMEDVTAAYREAFPEAVALTGAEDVTTRVRLFISKMPVFNEFSEEEKTVLIKEGTRGLLMLRAAFSNDPCTAVLDDCSSTLGKLRMCLDDVKTEELAILSAICLAQPNSAESSDQVVLKLTECLQAQVRINNPEKSNAFTCMLFKLAILKK